jgi:hypothetical protein
MRFDPEAEAGYCIEQIRARNPFGQPVRRHGGVAVYARSYPWPAMMRDATAEHQPVVERPKEGRGIVLSCNCRYVPGRGGYYEPLEIRAQWDHGEMVRAYYEHLKAVGISQRAVKRTKHPRNREE